MEPTTSETPSLSTHIVDLEPRTRQSEVKKIIVEANLLLAQPEPQLKPDFPELASLRDLHLDSNPTFAYLKGRLEEFFEEQRAKTDNLHPDKSRRWKEALYSSLLKALLELTFTSQQHLRERYLHLISHWYSEKTHSPLPDIRPRSRTTVQERPLPTEHLDTVAISQRMRLSRIEIRKMDAVKPIEARSLSPGRTTSPLPKLLTRHKAFQGRRLQPFNDAEVAKKLAFLRERREKAFRAHTHHSMLMKRWGSARSRLDEIITQKHEMRGVKARVASESEDDEGEITSPADTFSASPVPQTFFLVEKSPIEEACKSRSQSRVERIRYAYRNLLPESQERSESPTAHANGSISLHCARMNTNSSDVRTPSPIDLTKSPLPESSRQRAELLTLKKKLAKGNIACNYDILHSALNRPTDLPKEHLSHLFLPSGGEYFTQNPFSNLGKKKKKKGKKKKKR